MSLVIGIAGTAKNTGKTTTTSAILDELHKNKIPLALTSIGYDGEETDNITKLPKPRIFVRSNDILATARECLKAGSASYDILEITDIMTPLGKIYIVKVTKDGLAVIAGPNKGKHLKYVVNIMVDRLKSKVVLVDGALNRIAPMVETDGIIITTGPSRNPNINALVKEIKALKELLNLPKIPKLDSKNFNDIREITLFSKDRSNKMIYLNYNSLIDIETTNTIISKINEIATVFIPALVSEVELKRLNSGLGKLWSNKTLIIKDPIKLIAGGEPETLLEEISKIKYNNGNIKVLKNLPLLAVTVNPFYPKYSFDKGNYEPCYIDRNKLLNEMRTLNIPVIDVKYEGTKKLLEIILKNNSI